MGGQGASVRHTRRRQTFLAALLPAVVCAAFALFPPAPLTRLDLGVYDTVLRHAGTRPADDRIVIVDVDERSLAMLGQWPWRRDVVGRLIDRLRVMEAQTIALDIIFSEPDRGGTPADLSNHSAPDFGARTSVTDAALAEMLRGGRVVIGYAFTFGKAEENPDRCVLHPLAVAIVQTAGADADTPLFRAADAVCSLPVLSEAAGASGFLNASPDEDGVLRRVPLVLEWNGRTYPSLALATMMAASSLSEGELRVVNANTALLTVGDRVMPLDGRGNVLLRYRGQKRAFSYVSAADVLTGRLPADMFKGKIVFVGATALGTQEYVATPYDPLFIGVEAQATVADNLLRGDFLRRPEHALIFEALVVIFTGVVIAWAMGGLGIAWGTGVAGALLALMWGGSTWLLSVNGMFLSPLLPTMAIAMSCVAVALTVLTHDVRAALVSLQRSRGETELAASVKDEFLMTVSHELRTPLTTIYGYAQILAKGALRDEQKSRALATIERNAMAQTQLIDDLLDASQVNRGRLRLDVQAVSLREVIDSVVESLDSAIQAKHLAVRISTAGETGSIRGDPERLQQVVWHLVSNAVKFTPDGGSVDVSLARAGGSVELKVSDTGMGIAPEFLPHVFERFRQQDGGTTREHGGLGLGLALVRSLVELHGGSVDAESGGAGRGATFRVLLPIRVGRPEAFGTRADTSASTRLDGVQVLVADDQPEERTLCAAALLRVGANVVTAASVKDALVLLRDESRDVLIVNADMAHGEGYWLAREAFDSAVKRGSHLTTVAIASSVRMEDRRRALDAAIDVRVARPIDPAELVSVVKQVTRARANKGQAS